MSSDVEIRNILESDALIDQLAAIEHERWAHWQRYLHEQCEQQPDGSLLIPGDLVARWSAQIATPYSALSAREQESDREQVRAYLPTVVKALTQQE